MSSTNEQVKDIIQNEEQLYKECIKKGTNLCKKRWKTIEEITGKDLAWLRQTHGLNLEVVEGIYNQGLSKKQVSEFTDEYEKHKQTGKLGYQPEKIEVLI